MLGSTSFIPPPPPLLPRHIPSLLTPDLKHQRRPSPPMRDVGRFDPARRREGKEERQGRPRKWEARTVCHEHGPQLSLWPVFTLPSSTANPTDQSLPNSSTPPTTTRVPISTTRRRRSRRQRVAKAKVATHPRVRDRTATKGRERRGGAAQRRGTRYQDDERTRTPR
jgi:hypothetical protein